MSIETVSGEFGGKEVIVIDTTDLPGNIEERVKKINGDGIRLTISQGQKSPREIVISRSVIEATRGNQELVEKVVSAVVGYETADGGEGDEPSKVMIDDSAFSQIRRFFDEHIGSKFSISDIALSAGLEVAWSSLIRLPGLARLKGVNQHVAVTVVAVTLLVGKVIYDKVTENK